MCYSYMKCTHIYQKRQNTPLKQLYLSVSKHYSYIFIPYIYANISIHMVIYLINSKRKIVSIPMVIYLVNCKKKICHTYMECTQILSKNTKYTTWPDTLANFKALFIYIYIYLYLIYIYIYASPSLKFS